MLGLSRRLLPACLLALLLVPTPARAAPLTTAQEHALIAIRDAAAYYGVSAAYLTAIAKCESGLDPSAYNPASGAYGLFQWEGPTWAEMANQLDQWKGRGNAWSSAFEAAKAISEGQSWRWECAQ